MCRTLSVFGLECNAASLSAAVASRVAAAAVAVMVVPSLPAATTTLAAVANELSPSPQLFSFPFLLFSSPLATLHLGAALRCSCD